MTNILDAQGNPIREGFYQNINCQRIVFVSPEVPGSETNFFYQEELISVSVRLTDEIAKNYMPLEKNTIRNHIQHLRASANFLESKLK